MNYLQIKQQKAIYKIWTDTLGLAGAFKESTKRLQNYLEGEYDMV